MSSNKAIAYPKTAKLMRIIFSYFLPLFQYVLIGIVRGIQIINSALSDIIIGYKTLHSKSRKLYKYSVRRLWKNKVNQYDKSSREDRKCILIETPGLELRQVPIDLKAFERRLTEVITCLRPGTIRWRIILVVSTICTAIGAWQWLNDPFTSQVSFLDSLLNNLFFTTSTIILTLLFLMGIHKRVVTPSIITARTRVVLADFNMSCDETGKLILKPRPANS